MLEAVPADQRSPLFDQAAELLDEAGWGLDELYAAATDGRRAQRPVPGAGTGDLEAGALRAHPRARGPDLEARMADQGRSPPGEDRAAAAAARDQGRRADRLPQPSATPLTFRG